MMRSATFFFIILPFAAVVAWLSLQAQSSFDLKASMERGRSLYAAYCQSCHGAEGLGMEGVFPPLAGSDYLMANRQRAIQLVLYGASGEITVKGKVYNQPMPGFDLSDREASDVLNYIRNAFGNKGDAIMPPAVKAARK
ncbi:c-type cytochrome [Chitinophaga japonensis]|uniref:Nitrite reductase (NO-forming) n=1 Tax=Chitinophaga japonensis TaxID=104662 RepID=A0A562T5F7_CHIJA|nr:cytochrome c [Chitinophaga japonensis]TWI88603.1 nitrite reductase (NO-forming) [Chitinophaga japonensis]